MGAPAVVTLDGAHDVAATVVGTAGMAPSSVPSWCVNGEGGSLGVTCHRAPPRGMTPRRGSPGARHRRRQEVADIGRYAGAVATFHGIPGADPPGARTWVEHVLRGCVVAGVLGVVALTLGWLRAQNAWTPWLIALPGIAGPLLLLPWWWAPERRSANVIIMMRTALIPSVALALATRSLGVILGVLVVIALDLLAPRIASPAFHAAGVPAGRISAFSLWRHRRRVLNEVRAKGRESR